MVYNAPLPRGSPLPQLNLPQRQLIQSIREAKRHPPVNGTNIRSKMLFNHMP